MSPDKPAPGKLELVRCVLNSDDRLHDVDHASDVDLLNRHLAGSDPEWQVDQAADLPAVRDFRDAVRRLLVAPSGRSAARLAEISGGYSFAIRFDQAGRALLVPDERRTTTSLDRLRASVVAAICEAQLDGSWSRLRACRRFDCGWVFYDSTTSNAVRWCSSDPCGNVMKTRAYRSRRQRRT